MLFSRVAVRAARAPLRRLPLRALSSSGTPPPSKESLESTVSSIKQRLVGTDPARQRAAERLVEVQKKGGSFGDALRGGITAHATARKDEAFREETDKMLAMETFEWSNLRGIMEQALEQTEARGVRQKISLGFDYLRGGSQTEQLEAIKKEVRNYIKVIDELTPSEKRNTTLLTTRARQLISQRLGFQGVKEVNESIERFEFMKAQHGWLKREAARGRRLPADQQELGWMMRQRPTREYQQLARRSMMRGASRSEREMKKKTNKLKRPLG